MPKSQHPTPRHRLARAITPKGAPGVVLAALAALAGTAGAAAAVDRSQEHDVRADAIESAIATARGLNVLPGSVLVPASTPDSTSIGGTTHHAALAALRDDGAAIDGEALLRNERGLEVEIVAGAWLARLGGDVQLGEDGTVFRIDRRIRNDDLEVTPLVEFSFLDEEGFIAWRIHAFDFSSEAPGFAAAPFTFGALSFATGDVYETATDMTSAGVEYVVHRWTAVDPGRPDGPGIGRGDARLDFSGIAGVRWIAVDQRITRPGTGTEDPDADWIAAYVAARFEFTWAPEGGFIVGRSFRITGEYGIGPGLNAGGGGLWHVRAGAELELSDSIRGYFGYRLLELGLEDGDWEFDSGLQGLFVGATIQF